MNVFSELSSKLEQMQLARDEAAAKELHLFLQEYYEYKSEKY